MNDELKTILKPSTGEFRCKGSKFYSFAFPVTSLIDIKNHLDQLKKQYPDATHICYAYRLNLQNRIDDFSTDSGEPRGSAGSPILNTLKRENLVNAAVFVIRYYGGSKLGIPGLIKAYSKAAESTLFSSQSIKWQNFSKLTLVFSFVILHRIISIVEKFGGKVVNQKFEEDVTLIIQVPETQKDEIIRNANDISLGTIKIIEENL